MAVRRTLPLVVALLALVVAPQGSGGHGGAPGRAHAAAPPAEIVRPGARILVLSPHPDDEVLAAGGLIQEARRAGADVWAAVVTSGESSRPAAVRALGVVRPNPDDFARLGQLRRYESRQAAAALGLPPSRLLFLGYADAGLMPLWLEAWDCSRPRVSGRARVDRSPLADGFRPRVAYCAPNLLEDLERLLGQVRPDAVVLPDPADRHPDHAALANFGWAAVTAYDRTWRGRTRATTLLGYLVHYPGWPSPWGLDPSRPQAPPAGWTDGPVRWLRLPLGAAAVAGKERALSEYRSQLAVSPEFLQAFVRRDELFTVRPAVLGLGPQWTLLGRIPGPAPSAPPGGSPSCPCAETLTLRARSPAPGWIQLQLSGRAWGSGPRAVSLYAWGVEPGGPYRRLELRWQAGTARLRVDGREVQDAPRWEETGDGIAWVFAAGSRPWQVGARVAYPGRGAVRSPWWPVAARTAP